MNEHTQSLPATCETLVRIEEHVRHRLPGLLCDFSVDFQDYGLVLRGRVPTYHAKQMAQHAVMTVSRLPIRANEIEVSLPNDR
jgi:hypothetical protein